MRIVTFPTGWDEPDHMDLQTWAMLEYVDCIGQLPLDACPFIPAGSSQCEPDDITHGFVYPSTIKRD